MVIGMRDKYMFMMRKLLFVISVAKQDISCPSVGTYLRKVFPIHSKLTRKDPRRFGYLRIRLFLFQMSLITRKRHELWYMNNDCLQHMTREMCMFKCLTLVHGGIVTFGDNKKRRITRVGKIGIPPYPLIDNVLFLEGLKHNLLSISQLCNRGYDVSFNKDECIVQNNDGSLLFSTKRKCNIFYQKR